MVSWCMQDIYNDLTHNLHYFQTDNIHRLDINSDGSRSQYKGTRALFADHILALRNNVLIDHWFTATAHGKSVGDGLGGILKRYQSGVIET